MTRTLQEFKRGNIRELFSKVLQSQEIKLKPFDVLVRESWDNDFTMVDLSVEEEISGIKKIKTFQPTEAKGFVDGIFKACLSQYVAQSPSLRNIRLTDYRVVPHFDKLKTQIGSDATTGVTIVVRVKEHGTSEFSYTSRSILYSSFSAILQAFEFYINCDRTFDRIQLALDDAESRNRGDIVQSCLSDLSKLTGVNTYEKTKEKN